MQEVVCFVCGDVSNFIIYISSSTFLSTFLNLVSETRNVTAVSSHILMIQMCDDQ